MTELLAGTRSVVILVKMFPNRIDMEAVVQLPSRADARRPQVAAVHAPVGYRIEIIAVAARPRACRANGQRVAQRDIDHPARAHALVIAGFQLQIGFEIARLGHVGDHVYDAAGGVAAIERALRSAGSEEHTSELQSLMR